MRWFSDNPYFNSLIRAVFVTHLDSRSDGYTNHDSGSDLDTYFLPSGDGTWDAGREWKSPGLLEQSAGKHISPYFDADITYKYSNTYTYIGDERPFTFDPNRHTGYTASGTARRAGPAHAA